ncbi:MAG: hypothetical protein WC718_12795 [Phycisphaerales bacterium]|jgi:hypothetical protein
MAVVSGKSVWKEGENQAVAFYDHLVSQGVAKPGVGYDVKWSDKIEEWLGGELRGGAQAQYKSTQPNDPYGKKAGYGLVVVTRGEIDNRVVRLIALRAPSRFQGTRLVRVVRTQMGAMVRFWQTAEE